MSTDTAIVLRERYETKYGLYNHDTSDPDRPLALLGLHWGEDNSEGSVLYERIEQYEEREVWQRFGLSLSDFLELPSDVCRCVMEIAGKRLKEKAKVTSDIKQQLEKTAGDSK